jgi:superfamily II DNA or RNA helicase
MILRPYQQDVKDLIYNAWNEGHRNTMAVMPTGAGKTVVFGSVLNDHQGASCAVAHRQELVGQISMSLARYGVRHKIIGPIKVVKYIINEHMVELGTSFYDPNAQCGVAGVDTLLRRADKLKHWLNQITMWVQDEGHHILRENKWGKAADLMPNARGLAVTATPIRADGKGLGRHADGLMDTLVEGPSMRWLIDNNYLTDYRVFAPPSDLDLRDVTISQATGDYNPVKLKKAVQRSHLVGDVVGHYLRLAAGKQGITFATDVETATEIAVQFNQAGVRAEVVSAKTPERLRNHIMRQFRNKELHQLVNVDLFGEGVDIPAIEVVSMARPTQSYGLYVQQFGRALRPMDGKTHALIIDHASNVIRHGLPDREREWSLDSRGSVPRGKNPDDDIPLRYCDNCTQPYERIFKVCPYCGHYHEPEGRSRPEQVDGDLTELTPEILAEMRGELARVNEIPESVGIRMQHAGAPIAAVRGAVKNCRTRQEVQAALRESISWWAGIQRHRGRSDSESYRMFYYLFGTDVLTACTLGKSDAIKLAEKINDYIGAMQ